ncbi:MAG: hypothetical protein N2689_05030 [Verrucomicrobiae bacterium]|nr:hypothetical protein [Verrucomicrobiae bacterium]
MDVALVGMDGMGKGALASSLKAALARDGLTAQIIDLPHYSDLQGVSLFRGISRSSKALIERGVRHGSNRAINVGSLLAALPVRTARAMTRRAAVRLIVRHPGIEVDALAHFYARSMARLAKLVAKSLAGPLPRVIVFVTGSPRVALQRINADKTRHGQWKVGDFPHETEHNLASLDRLYRRTVHLLKHHHAHGLELIEVNGERPVEENTRHILRRMRELELVPGARHPHRHGERP